MQTVLAEALTAVAAERPAAFDSSFRLAAELVREFGETGLADRLISEIPADIPWEVVADLFGILEWSTSDNGAADGRPPLTASARSCR